jgi:outer membrane biosynthesis protein TonB
MSRSTAAFLIALMFHLLIILVFLLLGFYAPELEKKAPPQEHRIKVSLQERPEVTKDAALKNKSKPTEEKLMPKGKQLKEITQEQFKKYVPKPQVKPQPPVTKIEPKEAKPLKPKSEPLPPEKPFITVAREPVVKRDENRTKSPEEHAKLHALLSKPVKATPQEQQVRQSAKRESKLLNNIKDAYGETFGELSPGEQKYILDNQEIMRRITQEVLNRVGRVNIPNDLRVNSFNIVEFDLYPNGDISEIRFIEKSNFYILDDTTKETIQYAYSKYPRPEQKTRIRYKVGYYLGGY